MHKIIIAATTALLFAACSKKPVCLEPPVPPHPPMTYKDLQGAEVRYLQGKGVDVDNDGTTDFLFKVQLVGDPILERDRVQFMASSGIDRHLLNDALDQSPMLNKLDPVLKEMPGYDWWQISSIVLAEKIITYNGTSWEGLWKAADHKFLPVQVKKGGKLYNGWIELSFSTTEEKLVLHKSALSTVEDATVKAGYQ